MGPRSVARLPRSVHSMTIADPAASRTSSPAALSATVETPPDVANSSAPDSDPLGDRLDGGPLATGSQPVAPSHPQPPLVAQPTPAGLWWLSPASVVLLVIPASLALAWHYPDEVFRRAWTTPKSLSTDTVLQLAAVILVFVAVSGITVLLTRPVVASSRWPLLSPPAVALLRRAHWWLFGATAFGYAALLAAGFARGARPADLVARLTGGPVSADALKAQFAPVTGITSLTQLGIGFVIVTAVLLATAPRRADAVRLLLVLSWAVARAMIASERLAIMELILPLVAVLAMAAASRVRLRPLLRWLPALLVPLGVGIFAAFEYGRTWAFYRTQQDGSFLAFAAERFAGYYATAYNNGHLLLTHAQSGVPYLSVQGVWEAPGVAQSGIYERLNPAGPPDMKTIFTAYGNPEFNNPCGICLPVLDFGLSGALLFFAAFAVLVTLAYVAFLRGSPVGLLVYPALFTGLWELPRYLYWTQGRLLPTLVVLVAVGLAVARAGPPSSAHLTMQGASGGSPPAATPGGA